MEPAFLGLEEVLEIHLDQLRRHGGSEGLRDAGLLESALAAPRAGMGGQYFHGDLFEMAAAYLFHLSRNHPFVDGNKRTAAVAALVFLELNGMEIRANPRAYEDLVVSVASGKAGKADAAGFFRAHAR